MPHRRLSQVEDQGHEVVQNLGLRARTVGDLGADLSWPSATVQRALSRLRRKGVAQWGCVLAPEAAGAPVHVLTYIKMRHLDPTTMAAFEDHIRQDAAVSQASLVCGKGDYALWSWHNDRETARAWAYALELREEIARVDMRILRVLFGHNLNFVPIFRDQGQKTRSLLRSRVDEEPSL